MKTPPVLRAKRASLLVALAALSLAGCGGSGGTTTASSAPKIKSQPQSASVAVGSSVTFTVKASGGSDLTYQWYRGNQAISGATSASYTIDTVTTGDYGTYSVTVTNAFSSTTSVAATLSQPDTGAPKITTQPTSLSVAPGGSATFSVVATGEGTLTYQWYRNGVAISGATDSNYTIASVGSSDAASYFVKVTNDVGSVNSSQVTLSIATATAPVITTQPAASVSVNQNAALTLTVVATGKSPLAYQWFKNGTAIAGATASTYRIDSASTSDAGVYHVVVSNDLGTVTSSDANVAVVVAPSIVTQPTSQTAYEGSTATFTVTASGTPVSYAWYHGGTKISTSATLTISPVSASDAGQYYVVVTNQAGSAKSDTVTLTVYGKPTITSQPVSKTVGVGQTATFSVSATGQGSLTFQWFKNGTAISGAVGSTYTTPATTQATSGSTYYVQVTNPAGTTQSNTVTLTVIPAPTITSQPQSQTVTAGHAVSFGVTATGTGTLTYQWYKDGVQISGATNATYSISSASSTDAGTYYVIVTDSGVIGTTSNNATLTVN